jgi:hypothetical protein
MKTIEEAAKSANAYGYPNYTGANNEAFDSGFKSGVEFAQRWIPVEEDLPEMSKDSANWSFEKEEPIKYSDDVLVKTLCGCVLIGCYSELGTWVSDDLYNHEIVSHWRPVERL